MNSTDVFSTVICKSASAQVRVTISKWNGRHIVHVREYVGSNDQWRPTSKGIALVIDKLGELVNAIRMAEAETIKRGLLSKGRAHDTAE
jgi:hypothetical protein